MQLGFFNEVIKGNRFDSICKELTGEDSLTPDQFGKGLHKWSDKNVTKNIKVLALFSGAGGLDIGFHDCGFNILETVELESKFVQSQIQNKERGKYLTHTNIICEDIRNYEPKFSDKIDFIIGGPPCQSFSAAGRRAAGVKGTKDERGGLFWEYVRILEKLNPEGFLFENVYGLLGAEKGEAIKKIENAFKEVGYTLSYRILDAADYGVPQHRERLIIVGSKTKKFKFPKPTHGTDSQKNYPHLSAEKALEGIDNPKGLKEGINGRFGHLLNEVPPGLNYSFFTEKMGHPKPIFAWRSKFSDFLYKADPLMPVRTLKASGGQYTGPFHWNNRKFTINELKRLQTFPDDYIIAGNYGVASKQIGNSVPPQFSRFLALSILNQIFEVTIPFNLEYLEENEPLSFRKQKSKRTKLYASIAKEAIDKLEITRKTSKIENKDYRFDISSNFLITENNEGQFRIKSLPRKKSWTLNLYVNDKKKKYYEIEITSSKNDQLFNEIELIKLVVYNNDITGFNAIWKILEKELAKENIKADLVQLSGYYQYSSNLNFKITFHDEKILKRNEWKLIELILNDDKIGKIQNIEELAVRYDMRESELFNGFKELRKIGYEIRNNNTNSEIEKGSFLIPYKFPTLTSQSVQLNKKL